MVASEHFLFGGASKQNDRYPSAKHYGMGRRSLSGGGDLCELLGKGHRRLVKEGLLKSNA